MKTTVGCLRFIVFLLLLAPVSVWSQNSLWIDTVSAGPQQEVHLSLNVSNADTIVAFQCDILLPSQLSYIDNSAHLTSRTNALTLAATLITPNTLRVIAYSVSGAAIQGNIGAVLTFNCMSKILPGTYSIPPVNAFLSNAAQQNILTSVSEGQFVLLAPELKTSADSLDFGRIPLGQSSDVTVTVSNVGNLPLNLQGISSTLAEIVVTDSSSITINAYSSITRTLRFQPLKKGAKLGIISLKSNDPRDSMKVIKVQGIAYAVNEIHVGTATARSGYQMKLRLSVNNMEPFVGLQCVLHLPPVMKYLDGSAVVLSRKIDHTMSVDTTGNSLSIVCYSPSNSTFQGNSGDVVELTFLITGQGGTYTALIDAGILADSTATNIMSASYDGSLQVAAPKLQLSSELLDFGSISSVSQGSQAFSIQNIGSDTLNITSMAVVGDGYTINQSLPLVLAPGQNRSAQVVFSSAREGTHAGSITIRSNDVSNDPAVVGLSGFIFLPNVLSVEQDSVYENRSGLIRIGLWNLKPITAIQFDLTIPSGLVPSIDSLRKTSRATNHILQASSLGSNIYRFILYSPTSAVLNDSIGDILELPIYASSQSGSYPVQFQNVSIGDIGGHNISTGQQNGTIKILDIALPFLSQSLIDFGNVRKDDSVTQRVTLFNRNLTYIILKPISFSSSQGFDLIQSSDSSVLQPGDSVSIWVKFKPASFGTFTDTVKVASDGGSVTIPLSGTSPLPILTSLKTSIAYGDVAKNTTRTDTVKVVNGSINSLVIDSIYTNTSAFAVDRISGTVGTDTLKVVVSFTPTTIIASYTDTVYLRNNSANPLAKIPLSGSAPAPVLSASTTSLAFGEQVKGDSATMTAYLRNTSISAMTISGIMTNASTFTATSSSATVVGGDSIVLTVKFKPTSFGTFADTVTVISDGGTAKITVSGTSPIPVLTSSSSSIVYGSIAKNTTKKDTMRVVNGSINSLVIDSIFAKTSAFAVDRISGTVGSDTLKIAVSFTPTASTSYADTLYLRNNSANPLVKIPLSGSAPAPVLSASTASLGFGEQVKGDSAALTIQLKNGSISALTISRISTNTSTFTATSRSTTVAGEDSTVLTVKFKPAAFGVFIDTVTVISDGGAAKIAVSGTSPIPVLASSSSSIAFGSVAKNTTKKDTVRVVNGSINILFVDSIYTKTSAFTMDRASGTVGTDTLRIVVSFAPTAAGSYADTLYLRNNSANPLVKIHLSGSSPAPVLNASTTSLNFGEQVKGDSATMTAYLRNTSISAMTISGITTNTSVFTATSNSTTVASGDSTVLAVKFKPTSFGTFTDTVTVISDGGIVKIGLSGGSPKPILQMSAKNIAFGNVGLLDSAKLRLKITNRSLNMLTVDSIYTTTAYFTTSLMNSTISVKDSFDLDVWFKPSRFGSFADTLYLRNNSDTILQKVPLSGNTPYSAMVVVPSKIFFGSVNVDSTAQKIFAITDTSVSWLRVDSLYTGTHHFNVVHSLANNVIHIGDTVHVTIRFTPDSVKSYTDTLYIANNSSESPFKISLAGVGSPNTGVPGMTGLPTSYSLEQNYPNPFNPVTEIRYDLHEASRVTVKVYDVLGREVATVVDAIQEAGARQVSWDGRAVASGLYFYCLDATSTNNPRRNFTQVKKMLLLK